VCTFRNIHSVFARDPMLTLKPFGRKQDAIQQDPTVKTLELGFPGDIIDLTSSNNGLASFKVLNWSSLQNNGADIYVSNVLLLESLTFPLVAVVLVMGLPAGLLDVV
jgi:hypothetical protein